MKSKPNSCFIDDSAQNHDVRLRAIVGPFLLFHREYIRRAYESSKIRILFHPLSCYEARIRTCLGSSVLHEAVATPFDLQESASPFHQILLFDFGIDYPITLITRPTFSLYVELVHCIPGEAINVVASQRVENVVDEIVFPMFAGGEEVPAEGAVMCDLMRLYLPKILPPFPRIPSPSFTDSSECSDYAVSRFGKGTMESSASNFHGDIVKYSGSVCNTFAGLIRAPAVTKPEPNEKICVYHTRLFKSVVMPPYPMINQLMAIINWPIIDFSNISQEKRDLLVQFKEFSARYPSGLLKLAYMDVKLDNNIKCSLPTTLALFLLSPSRIKQIPQKTIDKFAISSLLKANSKEILNFATFFVEQAIPSQSSFDFLVKRSVIDPEFAVSAYWAFHTEFDQSKRGNDVKRVYRKWKATPECKELFKEMANGKKQLQKLKKIICGVKTISGKENKINYVKQSIKELDLETPFRLPLCPSFIVHHVSTENIIVFGSSLQPVKMDFINEKNEIYSAILKVGDDMRQDALALTTIRFIDDILKRFNIDMHLTPYSVVPISKSFGICEFVVGAKAISKILEQTKGYIEDFFDPKCKEECRDRFIKSSAAYIVISYVLGVGDRHLDNLLMTSKGKFFHVDFGYLFGQDPKPLPCAVRVIPEMISALDPKNAKQTTGYTRFLRYCAIIYNAIRRKADEICCLIALMREAELPHLPKEDTKIAAILLDRLHLELTEKQAEKQIVNEIDRSVAALFPKIFEWLHQAKMNFS